MYRGFHLCPIRCYASDVALLFIPTAPGLAYLLDGNAGGSTTTGRNVVTLVSLGNNKIFHVDVACFHNFSEASPHAIPRTPNK